MTLKKICNLDKIEDGKMCDVIGVVEKCDETKKINTKIGEKDKRTVVLSDCGDDGKKYSVELTFWGKQALQSYEIGKVMLVKNAKKIQI